MKRRPALAAAFTAVILMAAVLLICRHDKDPGPMIDGRPLGEWVSLVSVRNPARFEWYGTSSNAIQRLGTNSLPYLAVWGRYEPQTGVTRRCAQFLLNRLRPGQAPLSLTKWAFVDPDLIRADGVPIALRFLGPIAEGVVTDLRASANPATHTEWRVTNFFKLSDEHKPVVK